MKAPTIFYHNFKTQHSNCKLVSAIQQSSIIKAFLYLQWLSKMKCAQWVISKIKLYLSYNS